MKSYLFNQLRLLVIGCMLSLWALTNVAFAQSTVSGKVTAADDGGALVGATITEKGTNNGTTADANGNFKLNVGGNATIVVSFIGYTLQEVPVNNRSVINVVLKTNQQQLQDVVVVGY
jgi:hypothetical protein